MNDKPHEFEAHDFFRGDRFVNDPYSYFDYLREQSPVMREPHQGIFMVTGYDEAVEIYNDPGRFSSCMSTTGPMMGCPIPLEGHEDEDISELIEAYRDKTPFSDQITTMDPPEHTKHRALLMALITPKRLKENEDFMWELADQQIDRLHFPWRVRNHGRLRPAFRRTGYLRSPGRTSRGPDKVP